MERVFHNAKIGDIVYSLPAIYRRGGVKEYHIQREHAAEYLSSEEFRRKRSMTLSLRMVPELRTARPPTATITVRFGLCGAPRRGQGAGRAGGEGGGGAGDQRLPDMLLYHGQRRAPGAELGSRHGDQRRVESCSGLIGEPSGAGGGWRGAGHAGVWRPGRRAPHAPCTR